MNIPWRICHHHIEFPQNIKVKKSQITVDPLCMLHPFFRYHLLKSNFRLLILLNIMDQFAVRIVASVQMRTIPITLVSFLIDDGPEMFFWAQGVTFSFLTTISCTVITVLNIFLWFELQGLYFLLITSELLKLNRRQGTWAYISIFYPKRDGALRRESIRSFYSFYFGVAYLFCCWKVMGSGGGVTGLKWWHLSYS